MDSKLDFMENKIEKILKDSIKLNTTILRNKSFNKNILQISNIIVNAIKNNNKVLFFGNGGAPLILSIWQENLYVDLCLNGNQSGNCVNNRSLSYDIYCK